MFNPHLEIGQCINNDDIRRIFKCGNMGGMRRSHTTGTLVIVSDYTKGLYHDKWIGGVLHRDWLENYPVGQEMMRQLDDEDYDPSTIIGYRIYKE